MKFPIIAFAFVTINLFHRVQCLLCYESVGNASSIVLCSEKAENRQMCFSTTFGMNGLCARGCSFQLMHHNGYTFSLNCSEETCMKGLGCCCKGDLCNKECLSKATTIRYSSILMALPLLTIFKTLY
ncbi:hypothetical protein X798_03679 [Onchocerca flexuosa]|uniref:Uncharacterized protein n=1 Tax=Onchocerca flexuosa TaxID=387005 RepID=A0A238BXJ4_9BILA|nr:hypothetical protein X798_03679 [Onchocerca flexuosa]